MTTAATFDQSIYSDVLVVTTDIVANHSNDIHEQCHELTATQPKGPVLLDLQAADMIDSVGVALVVGFFKELRKHQIEMHVIIDSTTVSRVFQVMQLDRILTCYRANQTPHSTTNE